MSEGYTADGGDANDRRPRMQKPPVCDEDELAELKEQVFIPVEQFPGYNFVGGLLGPQGSILKGLQKCVNAKISIYGKGSSRDKQKEEQLRQSDDPEHAHLKEPLHVLIEVKGPRAEAHWRMANALTEIYKFMQPNPMDQYGGGGGGSGGESFYNNEEGAYDAAYGGAPPPNRGGRGGGPSRGGPRGGGPPAGGPPRGGGPMLRGRGGLPRGGPRGGGPPAAPVQPRAPPAAAPPAADPYAYTQETTNYQWDGNYNSQSSYDAPSSGAGADQSSNGYGKRSYDQTYDQSSYGAGGGQQQYGQQGGYGQQQQPYGQQQSYGQQQQYATQYPTY